MTSLESIVGVLLGTAVGDALGLPRENLSRRRAARLFGGPPLRHHFLFGHGMMSDDTEHTCMTAQALLRAPQDEQAFARSLGWRFRWWLLGLPAGVGRATARACVKLWLGFSPRTSGVFSAGNGPAMRAAILGVCLGNDPQRLRGYVRACTRITHTDPRAERGALLVALAARHGVVHGPTGVRVAGFLNETRAAMPDLDSEIVNLLDKMADHLGRATSAAELADALGLERGVSGYIYHTVIVALFCWLRYPTDFRRAVEEAIALGGDSDSTGAVVGAIMGATVGSAGIPRDWLDALWDWPRSVSWMRALASRLDRRFFVEGTAADGPMRLLWPGLIPRNLGFLIVVLLHGFRRLLPPY